MKKVRFFRSATMANTTFKEFLEIEGTPDELLSEAKKKKKKKKKKAAKKPSLFPPYYLGWLGPRFRPGMPWAGGHGHNCHNHGTQPQPPGPPPPPAPGSFPTPAAGDGGAVSEGAVSLFDKFTKNPKLFIAAALKRGSGLSNLQFDKEHNAFFGFNPSSQKMPWSIIRGALNPIGVKYAIYTVDGDSRGVPYDMGYAIKLLPDDSKVKSGSLIDGFPK